MELTNLKGKLVEWLRSGPQSDVAVSTRVRLARNIDGHTFVGRAPDEELERIEGVLSDVLTGPGVKPPMQYVRVHELGWLMLELLMERHLIGREMVRAHHPRGVAFDELEQTSVMVNEEDHLRIQVVRRGLQIDETFEQASTVDDQLGSCLPYAFSPKYGFLTACPTNTGTGMRASVMLHLPALVMAHEMDRVFELVRESHLMLRGMQGEGTQGAGDLYQVSNQVTLGVAEHEILDAVADAAERLVDLERSTRLNLYHGHTMQFMDRLGHAFQMLTTASNLSTAEGLSLLSQIRMGAQMDLLEGARRDTVNDLFLLTLPAHLQTMEGKELDTTVRNELRASYVKSRLTSGS